MDSLLSNYASSDEEEESLLQQQLNPPNQNQVKKTEDFLSENTSKSIKFSLPPPKSSSFSLNPPIFHTPKPQQHKKESDDELKRVENRENSKPSSLFSSLPQPKSSASKTHLTDPQLGPNPNPLSGTSAKRVVQFRPPLNPPLGKYSNVDDEDEDEDEEEKEKRRKKAESSGQTASVKSFLSSIPAPKNSATLGGLSSASGTGRRSIVQADVPALNSVSGSGGSEVGGSGNVVGGYNEGQYVDGAWMSPSGGGSGSLDYAVGGGSSGDYSNWGAGNENYVNYDGYGGSGTADNSNWSAVNGDYASYGSDSGNYGNYENNWSDGSNIMVAPELPAERELRLPAKRGRKDVPPQIIEVNQDELIKNRPREDQVKLTGIAFGPAYQPVSAKGKPSKLHKRKHQIGTLYHDMKQKEMELAERRAKGFQTKAQTQGKYGW